MNPYCEMEVFFELSLLIFVTTVVAGFVWFLRQPLIIGYILAGVIVGPSVLNIIHSTETLTMFSHVGISLLLFIVGLNLTPKVIRDVGKVSALTGVGQVAFTSIIGFIIAKMMGFSTITSAYLAVALTFSSTIIIMKLLSDKASLDTLYSKIAIGFLIVQDLIAVLILMLISSTHNGLSTGTHVLMSVLGGVGLLVLLFLVGAYALPRITRVIAKSQEYLMLFSLSWCLALASIFHYLNFSMEIGAILAGITLSVSPYRHEINSKMRLLRDFFIVVFFILMGSQMSFSNAGAYALPIVVFSLFILVGNPLIVMVIMGFLGYTRRNSFLSGLTVAQISEFSLILVALGIKLGHLDKDILSLVTAVGLVTIAGSTYMISYSNRLYEILSQHLKVFERRGRKVDEHRYHENEDHTIILFGCNRIGDSFLDSCRSLPEKFLVVDFNPEVLLSVAAEGVDCRYGDASDLEFLNELDFSKAKMVVSTIPDFDTNIILINKVRETNKKAIVIVVSHRIDEAMELYNKNATYVIMPHFLGAHHAAMLIQSCGLDYDNFLRERLLHIEHLKERKQAGHEHPTHDR